MFRAIGPLVNQQTFYDAFGIKEGDPMWVAPEKRAKIW
jgi:predicted metalloendopeptidase